MNKKPSFTHIKGIDFERLVWLLKQRKSDLNVSYRDIAIKGGIETGTVSSTISGRYNPSWATFKGCCRGLELDERAVLESCKIKQTSSVSLPVVVEPKTESIQGTFEFDLETESQKIEQAISLLKGYGYKVSKPVTQYVEL
jgi:transcriptional regulator with XRE-family HTH domain